MLIVNTELVRLLPTGRIQQLYLQSYLTQLNLEPTLHCVNSDPKNFPTHLANSEKYPSETKTNR